MKNVCQHSKQEVKAKSEDNARQRNVQNNPLFSLTLSAWVPLICTLCKCIVFIQVLQLAVSAPLVADFPVGDNHSVMSLKVLSEIANEEEGKGGEERSSSCPPQRSSSLSIHISLKRPQERDRRAKTKHWTTTERNLFWVRLGVESFVLSLLNPLKVEQKANEQCCVWNAKA